MSIGMDKNLVLPTFEVMVAFTLELVNINLGIIKHFRFPQSWLHLRPPSYARLNTLKTYTMREDNSCKHGFAFGLHNFSATSDRAVNGQQELIFDKIRG